MSETLYFAYGSNMNLNQMAHRCPDAKVVGVCRAEGFQLAFRGGSGVATILPQKDSFVEGVLWRITERCEQSLNRHEGYPHLYDKETIQVHRPGLPPVEVMVYTINEPYRSQPALPSPGYLHGILEGCRQNGVSTKHIKKAVEEAREASIAAAPKQQTLFKIKKRNQER